MTRLAVLYYASTNVHPRLRDSALMQYFFPQTATTMLMSTSAVQLQTMNQTTKHPNDPSRCKHPSCLRSHWAGGMSISICDLCGSASPTARTPLFPKGSDLGKIVSNRTAQPRASNQNSGSSARASSSYSQRSLLPPRTQNPGQRTSMTSLRPKAKLLPQSRGAPTAWNPRSTGLTEEELVQMQWEFNQWKTWGPRRRFGTPRRELGAIRWILKIGTTDQAIFQRDIRVRRMKNWTEQLHAQDFLSRPSHAEGRCWIFQVEVRHSKKDPWKFLTIQESLEC